MPEDPERTLRPRRVPPSAGWTRPELSPARDLAQAAILLKQEARALGFDPVGIAPPRLSPRDGQRLARWLEAGQQGTMTYMALQPERRIDAEILLPRARAVLLVGLAYPADTGRTPPPTGRARISTYAQAPYDYHRVLAGRLALLEAQFSNLVPGGRAQRFCDTSPLLERAFAQRAGLGFVGKNTSLIHPRRGSNFFLGGLVLDRELPPDEPNAAGSCGTCTRCLDACPTGAFPEPYVLDARRCVSYLTIEHRGAYDEELREGVGAHSFGCDVCQAVCPWNLKFAAPPDAELEAEPARQDPPLLDLHQRVRASFKSLARGTPWERTGKRGFLRNLGTAMGNVGDASCAGALDELAVDPDPGVAEHAAWGRRRLAERMRPPS